MTYFHIYLVVVEEDYLVSIPVFLAVAASKRNVNICVQYGI